MAEESRSRIRLEKEKLPGKRWLLTSTVIGYLLRIADFLAIRIRCLRVLCHPNRETVPALGVLEMVCRHVTCVNIMRRCYIQGDVDFIFGSATAVFQNCEISSSGRGWITAASTPEDVEFGYVFIGCKLTGDAPEQSVGLGRPWRNYAKVAFVDCWLGPHIKAEGWDSWNERERVDSLEFMESGSVGTRSC